MKKSKFFIVFCYQSRYLLIYDKNECRGTISNMKIHKLVPILSDMFRVATILKLT